MLLKIELIKDYHCLCLTNINIAWKKLQTYKIKWRQTWTIYNKNSQPPLKYQ